MRCTRWPNLINWTKICACVINFFILYFIVTNKKIILKCVLSVKLMKYISYYGLIFTEINANAARQ